MQCQPQEYFVPCILYPRVDKGKSVEDHHAHTQMGKTGCTHQPNEVFKHSPFQANVLARLLGSPVRDGRGVVVLVRGSTPKPCKNHHAHNPVESSGSACHVVSTLDRGLCPGAGRSAPVRPKDRGLNGIKTPERTRPTSAPGYTPRHPTPRTLKLLAMRMVVRGVNMRYPPLSSGGDFCNRGAGRACILSSHFFTVPHRFSLSFPFPKQ